MATPAEREARIKQLDWNGLRAPWTAVQAGVTPDWEEGKAFEYRILRAFELDKASVRYPYSVDLFGEEVEEIDGAVHVGRLSCLVESKDWERSVAIAPTAKLRNQLLRRPAGTIGLMFSSGGFTQPAVFLAHFALPQAILLWDGTEVQYALHEETISTLLELKYRACVEEGIPDFNVRERGVSWEYT